MGALDGRRVAVTGASRGIGAACCAELAAQGATVVLIARDSAALGAVAQRLAGGPHIVAAFDVSDEAAWLAHRDRLAPTGHLDGIVTAAGVLTPIGPLGSYDIAGFRRTLEINVVGTLLAISTNLESLRRATGAVVTFSGGGATGPFPHFDAYAASKAAVVRLTENLAVALAPTGIRCNAVAPGFVVSDMHNETLAAGPERVGAPYYERTRHAVEHGGGDSPQLAAELTAFLLSPESAGITGKLVSARWDPWRTAAFRDRLRREPDLATLRRIDDQFFSAVTGDAP